MQQGIPIALQGREGPQTAISSFLSTRGQRNDAQGTKQRLAITPLTRLPRSCTGVELTFLSGGVPPSLYPCTDVQERLLISKCRLIWGRANSP